MNAKTVKWKAGFLYISMQLFNWKVQRDTSNYRVALKVFKHQLLKYHLKYAYGPPVVLLKCKILFSD